MTLGTAGVITFGLQSVRPVVLMEVDPLGDGLPAPTVVRGEDLRDVVALKFLPEARGSFELQMRVTDSAGCVGLTGLRRDLVVQ